MVSLGAIAGFIYRTYISVNPVLANQYIQHGLYGLFFDSLKTHTNLWTLIGAGMILTVALVICLLQVVLTSTVKHKPDNYSPILGVLTRLPTKKFFLAIILTVVTFLISLNFCLFFFQKVTGRPNIIMISMDTLRADHLSCYGYDKNTSPNIDRFAGKATLFKNCFIPTPWTLPSHISMITSLYPITHGVQGWVKMSPSITTLAEYLKNNGFVTLGFASHLWMQPWFGFQKGFDEYIFRPNGFSPDEPERNAERLNQVLDKALNKYQDKNLFLFIHYFDVHSDTKQLPYDAPPPYENQFSSNYDGNFTGGNKKIMASAYLKHLNEKQLLLIKKDRDYVASLYDNGIRYMDACIGDLFAILKRRGLYDNSIIILTSDHGEEFQEHGYVLHSNPYYYDELMNVPLIIKWPKAETRFSLGKKVDFLVESINIMPSILEYVNIKPKRNFSLGKKVDFLVESIDIMPSILEYVNIKPKQNQGQSFLDTIQGNSPEKKYIYGFCVPDLTISNVKSFMVRSESRKLVKMEKGTQRISKLFNLENDPKEQTDIVDSSRKESKQLKEKLQITIDESLELRTQILNNQAQKTSGSKIVIPKDEQEKLKALGYLQ